MRIVWGDRAAATIECICGETLALTSKEDPVMCICGRRYVLWHFVEEVFKASPVLQGEDIGHGKVKR